MRALWWILFGLKVIDVCLIVGLAAGVLGIVLNAGLCRISKRIFQKSFERFIKAVLILMWVGTMIMAVAWYLRRLNSLIDALMDLKPWVAALILAGSVLIYLFAWGMWSSARSDKRVTDLEEGNKTNPPETGEGQTAASGMSDHKDAG